MSTISRRNLFRAVLGRGVETPPPSGDAMPATASVSEDLGSIAVILDRFCLAWQGSFCSVCAERCPEAGAIAIEQGKPRVNPDCCTGCGICQDVCPAPKNAVFLVSRKPRRGMVQHPADPSQA